MLYPPNDHLVELRRERGLSMSAVARALGIHPSHLSRVERGHCRVSLELATRIETFFNGQIGRLEILYGPGAPTPRKDS